MEKKVREHINNIFKTYEQNDTTEDIKEELVSNLLERIEDLVKEGLNRNDAFNTAVGNLGSSQEIRSIFNIKSIKEYDINYKLNGICLLIATAIYLVIGFVFDFWHPGWIIYPLGFMVTATIEKKTGAIWLIAIAIYLVLGSVFDYWGLGLVVFGLAAALVAGRDEFIAGLWLLLITAYIGLGVYFGVWHPAWIIFIAGIAITVLIVEKSFVGFTWLIAIFGYLYLGLVHSLWHPYWVIFIVAAAIAVYLETGRNNE